MDSKNPATGLAGCCCATTIGWSSESIGAGDIRSADAKFDSKNAATATNAQRDIDPPCSSLCQDNKTSKRPPIGKLPSTTIPYGKRAVSSPRGTPQSCNAVLMRVLYQRDVTDRESRVQRKLF